MIESLSLLVDACLAGDERAIRQFVERFEQRVFGLCLRLLGQRQDAEDAAQDTFVRALRSLSGWDRERPIEPWLLAIAANRCRTKLARRRRRPADVPLLADEISSLDDQNEAARLLAEEVDRGLAEMRAEHARAFRLFHEQRMSYVEIATLVDCPLGTVKTWVHRARQELALRLIDRGVVEGTSHELRSGSTTSERVAG